MVSVLKLTKCEPAAKYLVAKDAGIPVQVADQFLKRFCESGLIQMNGNIIEASSNQRVKIAIYALNLGSDSERVCRFLEWIEFENLVAEAFEAYNFFVKRRFRFTWRGRKWEIDILGCRKPLVACIDCKHWTYGWRKSAITKAVEAQVLRTKVLAEAFPSLKDELGLTEWRKATLIPVVLSLFPGPSKFYKEVPVVPILQFQDFVNELSSHIESVKRFFAHF